MSGLSFFIYFKYRARLGSTSAIAMAIYAIVIFEVAFGGGIVIVALWIAGMDQYRWQAFIFVESIYFISLWTAMFIELKKCTQGKKGVAGQENWRSEIEKYVDYKNNCIDPYVSTPDRAKNGASFLQNGMVLSSIGVTSIPLAFEMYGGGRANAIYLVAPVCVGLWVYINMTTFGSGLMRVLLVRRLEKLRGFRFFNAELQKIQVLRRTFFLSRFLMLDYYPVPPRIDIPVKRRKIKARKF